MNVRHRALAQRSIAIFNMNIFLLEILFIRRSPVFPFLLRHFYVISKYAINGNNRFKRKENEKCGSAESNREADDGRQSVCSLSQTWLGVAHANYIAFNIYSGHYAVHWLLHGIWIFFPLLHFHPKEIYSALSFSQPHRQRRQRTRAQSAKCFRRLPARCDANERGLTAFQLMRFSDATTTHHDLDPIATRLSVAPPSLFAPCERHMHRVIHFFYRPGPANKSPIVISDFNEKWAQRNGLWMQLWRSK